MICGWLWTIEYGVYHEMMCCSILLGLWKVYGIDMIYDIVDVDVCDDDSYVDCDCWMCGHVYLIIQLLLR